MLGINYTSVGVVPGKQSTDTTDLSHAAMSAVFPQILVIPLVAECSKTAAKVHLLQIYTSSISPLNIDDSS